MAIYRGKQLSQISFPLGGIGAGCIGLAGNGHLIDWEIFNRPNKGGYNGMTHFALRAMRLGHVLDARVAQGIPNPPYSGADLAGRRTNFGFGMHRQSMAGLPNFSDCTFEGTFPIAKITLEDQAFPGKVQLTAFSPLIPGDEDASSIPAAFFTLSVQNTTDAPLDYDIALSLCNPAKGYCMNRCEKDGGYAKLLLESKNTPEGICAICDRPEVQVQSYWYRGAWFDGINMFWNDFQRGASLSIREYAPSELIGEEHGTLMASFHCREGETDFARFVIAWYFPIFHKYWGVHGEKVSEGEQASWVNWYGTKYCSCGDVATSAMENFDSLYTKTKAFRDALYHSTLSSDVLDAVSANLSTLKTPVAVRLTDGSFYGWEGLGADAGSCEGSCSHVWNYQYALPFLFPRLERSMRELDYKYNLRADGGMPFRLQLPPGHAPHPFRPCCDGQLGGVMKTWREWKISGDTSWMLKLWPSVKRSLEYAWSPLNGDKWDMGKTGVLTGRQHHTLDMELFGPNSWLTGFYLCALKAASEMAEAAGEPESAREYTHMFEKGRKWVDENLFNGGYYIQKLDLNDRSILDTFDDHKETIVGGSIQETYWNGEKNEIKYQIGEGCAIDQVIGQWHADLIGLGQIFDSEKVRKALESIYRYNYQKRIGNVFNPCRLFCVGGESGTMICAYPKDAYRPAINVPYAEETMHGFEYQAAIHMMMCGMQKEGEELVSAVRRRYDGEKRNPWNEFECGSNYARSMASYALVPALSGFAFDAIRGLIGFRPLYYDPNGEFRSVWSLDSGWGQVEVCKDRLVITLLGGELYVQEIGIPCSVHAKKVLADGQVVEFEAEEGLLKLKQAVVCKSQIMVQ